jgi:hypothetical protein
MEAPLLPLPEAPAGEAWPPLPGVLSEFPVPRLLSSREASPFVRIHADRLTFSYAGGGTHSEDCGAVQADVPLPADLPLFYFEVLVLAQGTKGRIGIGLAPPDFNLQRQPGWEASSYGYHGDDGLKYGGAGGRGELFAAPFGEGDVVGCGLLLSRGELFFTKNGVSLGTAFTGVRLPLLPTVALHSPGESARLNFGSAAAPFAFDVAALAAAETARTAAAAAALPLPPHLPRALVRAFLEAQGHARALEALDRTGGGGARPGDGGARAASLEQRAVLRRAAMCGDAAAVRAALGAFQLSPAAAARAREALRCLEVLEALRAGDGLGALLQCRDAMPAASPRCAAALTALAGLLPYHLEALAPPPPGAADALPPVARRLLAPEQRAALADELNMAALDEAPDAAATPAEQLRGALAHLGALAAALREAGGSQGPRLNVAALCDTATRVMA